MQLDVRRYLDEVAYAHAADPLGYLWEFGPIYAWWEGARRHDRQPIGFLTFHRLLIRSFRRTFPGGWIPVQPASLLPFPSALADAASHVSDLARLCEFSAAIEGWTGGVRATVGAVTDGPLARAFWELHLFVDSQFARALEASGLPWTTYLATVAESDQRLV